MRTLYLLLLLILSFSIVGISQSCLPEGITFTTQAQIDSFPINYPGCTEIEGDVLIESYDNNNITNLNGLSALTSIIGDLYIENNDNLVNLTGLDNITLIVGKLRLSQNIAMTSLDGLDNLTFIGGSLSIGDNWSLTNLLGLNSIVSIGGTVAISYNYALNTLTGLNSITSIAGYLTILANSNLTSLVGLNNLSFIGDGIWLEGNHSLSSLSGLDNLVSLGGGIAIADNDVLLSLTGMNNLTHIGDHLRIENNSSMISLAGLESVTFIGSDLTIYNNNSLISLAGIDNLDATSITGLSIHENNILSTCEVQCVCSYLVSLGAIVYINDNAPGCNTQQEVEAACGIGIPDINNESDISVYPNPTNNLLTITSKNGTSIEEVIIYNQVGQKVFEEKLINNTIDVSDLKQGMNIIELVGEDWRARKKLIKQ